MNREKAIESLKKHGEEINMVVIKTENLIIGVDEYGAAHKVSSCN